MPEALFSGRLDGLTLPGVLQLVEAESLTGVLRFDDARSVGFRQGLPVQARHGGFTGVSAMLELFVDCPESFGFHVEETDGQALGSVLGLIMEGCRLCDQYKELSDLVLIYSGPDADDPAVGAMFRALDGTRSFGATLRSLPVARVEVIDAAWDAYQNGELYEVTAPPPPVRQHAPGVGYAEAMEQGRLSLRAADFDAAEAAFQRALALRPDDKIASQNLRRVRQVRNGEGSDFTRWFRRAAR